MDTNFTMIEKVFGKETLDFEAPIVYNQIKIEKNNKSKVYAWAGMAKYPLEIDGDNYPDKVFNRVASFWSDVKLKAGGQLRLGVSGYDPETGFYKSQYAKRKTGHTVPGRYWTLCNEIATRLNFFIDQHPEVYMRTYEETCLALLASIAEGNYEKNSPSIREATKALGIKDTYKAIENYLIGGDEWHSPKKNKSQKSKGL